jgi:hypothetical protein
MSAVAATETQQRFSELFREEHRAVRDLLLEVVAAFEAHDLPRASRLLAETAAATGPHFRYEEESLYPALAPIFGDEYVEKLLGDHDLAIAAARILVELAGQDTIEDEEVAEAIRLVRVILPHVSDCDGLSIMVELLPDAYVESILASREAARAAGLGLLPWADGVRRRPATAP